MRVEIVLLESVRHLGGVGAIKSVKRGYARYLMRAEKALRVTANNLELFETKKAYYQEQCRKSLERARASAGDLEGVVLTFIKQAGETGQLYGSVTVKDILGALEERGVSVQADALSLSRPIKVTGVHHVQVQLHSEVLLDLPVIVAKTAEEAKAEQRKLEEPEAEEEHAVGEDAPTAESLDGTHEETQTEESAQ